MLCTNCLYDQIIEEILFILILTSGYVGPYWSSVDQNEILPTNFDAGLMYNFIEMCYVMWKLTVQMNWVIWYFHSLLFQVLTLWNHKPYAGTLS